MSEKKDKNSPQRSRRTQRKQEEINYIHSDLRDLRVLCGESCLGADSKSVPMGSAEEAAPAAATPVTMVPDKLLDAGEVVILAIKPSFWFVLLNSFPAVAAAGGVAMFCYALSRLGVAWMSPKVVLPLCAAVALVKVMASCVQWAGRLYVLTNVRIIRLRGVLRADVFQCPLRRIAETNLAASLGERVFSVGSLWFNVPDSKAQETAWLHIAQPNEVHEVVREAIRRAGR